MLKLSVDTIFKRDTAVILIAFLTPLVVNFASLEYVVFPISIFCTGLLIASFLIVYTKKPDRDFLVSLFFLAFISKTISAIFLYNFTFLLNNRGLIGDGWGYSENGYMILQLWLNGMSVSKIAEVLAWRNASGNLGGYDFWNAIVYFFTGKSPLSVVFINCLASSLTPLVIYYTAKQLANRKTAMIAATLSVFWPSLYFWSLQNFKEPIVIFLISIMLWAVIQLRRRFRIFPILTLIISSLLLKELRLFVLVLFYILILPLSLLLSLWKRARRKLEILLILLLLFPIFYLFIGGNIKHLLGEEGNMAFLERLHMLRTYRTMGASTAFLTDWDLTNLPNFVFFIPLALLFAWLAPFPWQFGSSEQIMAIPEMLVYYLLIPSMIFGAKFIIKNKVTEGGVLLTYILVITFVLALIEGNVGTLFRHRAMVLPFCFILIAIGLDRYKFIV